MPYIFLTSHCPVTIVITSRLVYRKGTDLLTAVIPRVCEEYSDVQFIIGMCQAVVGNPCLPSRNKLVRIAGDGPKRVELEQMRERYVLQERVQLLGAVDHAKVPEVKAQFDCFDIRCY